jgi:hypothetical protein
MPPVVVAAGIGAAASIGGGLLASSASKKAANKAASAQQQATNANNALSREQYQSNAARLDPTIRQGQAAGNALAGLLGLEVAPSTPALGGGGTDWAGYVRGNPDAMADWQMYHRDMDLADYGEYHWNADGARRDLTPYRPQAAIASGSASPQSANNAFDTFRNSTNYQFRLGEGMRALNQGYAAKGMLESGSALRGITDYAQNFASNELGNYMNILAQQQQMGLGAGSALAGVGQNMVGQVSANNNNSAAAQGNAALIAGQAQGQMYSSIANGIGSIAGSIFNGGARSGYQQPSYGGIQVGGAFGNTSPNAFRVGW